MEITNDPIRRYVDSRLTSGTWAPKWATEAIRRQLAQWASTEGTAESAMSDETGRWTVRTAQGTYLVAILRSGGVFVSFEAVPAPSASLLDFLFGNGTMDAVGSY